LLIVTLAVSACGGSGGRSPPPASTPPPGGGAGGPPPPPPPPPAEAPSALSYTAAAGYTVGTALSLDPTVTGTVTSYSVSPGLPAGISIDATTGRISGTPTAPARSATYTVTATNATGSTTTALAFSVMNERVTADRPDEADKAELHQIHVMYVLPSDAAADEQLDQTGTIEASLRVMNEWFATKTGKKLRFDTYDGGKLDVTYLKVPRTDVQMVAEAARSSPRKELDEQLYLHGFDSVKKMYLVYYGGASGAPIEGCGRGAWPPDLPGNVAAVYIGAERCRTVPFAAGNEPPAFLEFSALHEALHVLGFVPSCAPNYAQTGHVRDSRTDVMFSSNPNGTELGEPSELDVNLNDYIGPFGNDCLQLSNSAFLDPLPAAAEAPPTWPYVDLTDLGCDPTLVHTPGPLGAPTGIMFVNNLPGTQVEIYEQHPTSREFMGRIGYQDGTMLPNQTYPLPPRQRLIQANALFVVLVNGNCRRIVRATETPSRFMIE
jgi:hypothetical protein